MELGLGADKVRVRCLSCEAPLAEEGFVDSETNCLRESRESTPRQTADLRKS